MAITSGSVAPLKARRANISRQKHIIENQLEQLNRVKEALMLHADAAGQAGAAPDAFKQQEQMLNLLIERLQHWVASLETQEQSIEKKLSKNIQNTFKVFG